MCKFKNEIENITQEYGKQTLNPTGKEIFDSMPLDSQVRFILVHPTN